MIKTYSLSTTVWHEFRLFNCIHQKTPTNFTILMSGSAYYHLAGKHQDFEVEK